MARLQGRLVGRTSTCLSMVMATTMTMAVITRARGFRGATSSTIRLRLMSQRMSRSMGHPLTMITMPSISMTTH
jgi:hypothetical protein